MKNNELTSAKKELEGKIKSLIDVFEGTYGLVITNISLERDALMHVGGPADSILCAVDICAEVP